MPTWNSSTLRSSIEMWAMFIWRIPGHGETRVAEEISLGQKREERLCTFAKWNCRTTKVPHAMHAAIMLAYFFGGSWIVYSTRRHNHTTDKHIHTHTNSCTYVIEKRWKAQVCFLLFNFASPGNSHLQRVGSLKTSFATWTFSVDTYDWSCHAPPIIL